MKQTTKHVPYKLGTSPPSSYNEDSDCTVKALANAKGISYEEAHGCMQRIGRINGCGVNPIDAVALYRSEGFYVELFGTSQTTSQLKYQLTMGVEHNKGTTLGKLMDTPKYKTGKHIVGLLGHVVALVNGSLMDVQDNAANQAVHFVFTYAK
jgi:hypothetical protein